MVGQCYDVTHNVLSPDPNNDAKIELFILFLSDSDTFIVEIYCSLWTRFTVVSTQVARVCVSLRLEGTDLPRPGEPSLCG